MLNEHIFSRAILSSLIKKPKATAKLLIDRLQILAFPSQLITSNFWPIIHHVQALKFQIENFKTQLQFTDCKELERKQQPYQDRYYN